MSTDPKTFKFGEDDSPHEIGKSDCDECWNGYPKRCEDRDCSGLIHASFGDENGDGDYWLYKECDVCGGSE